MKKYQFMSETKWNNPERVWYYTKINDAFVSNSGSFDKDEAYKKFIHLKDGGTLEDVQEVLEEIHIPINL